MFLSIDIDIKGILQTLVFNLFEKGIQKCMKNVLSMHEVYDEETTKNHFGGSTQGSLWS